MMRPSPVRAVETVVREAALRAGIATLIAASEKAPATTMMSPVSFIFCSSLVVSVCLLDYESLGAAVSKRRRGSLLLDEREQLEHREVHRNDDHADHRADADHHQRLDDRRQRRDRRSDLVLIEVGDLREHLLDLS